MKVIGELNELGNTASNLHYGGIAAQYSNYIYYLESGGPGILRLDNRTGERVRVSEDHAQYLNVTDDGLFYLNVSVRQIYRCDHDGGNRRRVEIVFENPDEALQEEPVYVVGKQIFFYDDAFRFCRCRVDGGAARLLSTDWCKCVTVWNGQVYYQNYSTDSAFYVMDMNGNDIRRLTDEPVMCPVVGNGYIYYCENDDKDANCWDFPGGSIWRIKTDGTGKTLLREQAATLLNLTDNNLYFDDREKMDEMTIWETKGPYFGLLHACEIGPTPMKHPNSPLSPHSAAGVVSSCFFKTYNILGQYAFLEDDSVRNKEYNKIFPHITQIKL